MSVDHVLCLHSPSCLLSTLFIPLFLIPFSSSMFVSMSVFILGSAYEREPLVFVFLCQAYFIPLFSNTLGSQYTHQKVLVPLSEHVAVLCPYGSCFFPS